MTRRLALGGVGLLLAACASQPAAPPPHEPAAPLGSAPAATASAAAEPATTAREQRGVVVDIRGAIDDTVRVRQLPALRPVPGRRLERADLLDAIKQRVMEEIPEAALQREGDLYKLNGFLPLDADYKSLLFGMLEEQLAGFYAPLEEHMWLAADLDDAMGPATLVHELVHALQDQHFSLKESAKYRPGEGDKSFARSALAEGDATSAMTDFMMGGPLPSPDRAVERMLILGMSAAPSGKVPAILQQSLVAPYVLGLPLVNALRREGGWDAVNAAWKNPPTTSEQILHLDKFQTREPALAVRAPNANALGAGFVVEDEDTAGELGLQLVLRQMTSRAEAERLARDWGGDRSVLVRRAQDGAIAALERLQYDPAGHAKAKRTAAVMAKHYGAKPAQGGPAGAVMYCTERPRLGPLALGATAKGELLSVIGPTDTTRWQSAGSCAQALAVIRAELGK